MVNDITIPKTTTITQMTEEPYNINDCLLDFIDLNTNNLNSNINSVDDYLQSNLAFNPNYDILKFWETNHNQIIIDKI
jgi:hypothetical protein